MPIRFTTHARKRLAERKILEDWVIRALTTADWTESEPADPKLTRAYKTMPELGGRILRVVYFRNENGDPVVVTAFPDRNARSPV